jgi:hypothetical protein
MYQNSNNLLNTDSQLRNWSHHLLPQTLIERAQAYLDADLGTPESREIILGLLLANAQLREVAMLAEEITRGSVKAGRELFQAG